MSLDADERYLSGLLGAISRRFRKPDASGADKRQNVVAEGHNSAPNATADLERAVSEWGALNVHLVGAVLSMLSGCKACARTHIHAFQLHYLRKRNKLFSYDEDGFAALSDLSPGEMVETIAQAHINDGAHAEADLLRRAFELYVYPRRAIDRADKDILRLVSRFNSQDSCKAPSNCARAVEFVIPRDRTLRSKYQALRGI